MYIIENICEIVTITSLICVVTLRNKVLINNKKIFTLMVGLTTKLSLTFVATYKLGTEWKHVVFYKENENIEYANIAILTTLS